MSVDVVQAGLLVAEQQRKSARFNLRVFRAAWRDDACAFACIRSDDRDRQGELVAELRKALASNNAEHRHPAHWAREIQAHAATMELYSKLYGSGIVVFGALAVAVSLKGGWLYLIVAAVIPTVFALVKWGVDKYAALLTRVSAALSVIKEEGSDYGDTSVATDPEDTKHLVEADCSPAH